MKLISVSGCGHGGTTLMATIIGSHKNLYLYPYETWAFVDGYPEKIDNLLQNKYDDNVIGIVEKTPKHIYFIDQINNRYQDTSFVFMVRDPRDLVASLYKRTNDWNKSINRVYQDMYCVRLYQHLGLTVKYENLVTNLVPTIQNVCSYIDIDYDINMEKYYNTAPNWYGISNPKDSDGIGEDHESRRAWQVKQPLFNGYGRWEKELTKDQLTIIYDVLGGIAKDLGYDIDVHY